jgi:agmatinase/guanidinopropionase
MNEEKFTDTEALPAYTGIPTFMRRPLSRRLDNVDAVVMGIPFDGGATSYRSGARMGPRKIREASLLIWGHNRFFNIAPLDILTVVDYGDLAVEPVSLDNTVKLIFAEVSKVLDAGVNVIALGGDHSIALPLLRAHAAKYGPMALVHFDAHVDTEPDRLDHGTPFRYAADEGLINTNAWMQVGIRGPVSYPDEVEDARRLGAQVLDIDTCFEMGMPNVIRTIRDRIGNHPVYVSLDIDAVDPAYAPGTGTPEIGGFTSYQIMQLVRGLRGLNLVGFDLVEVSPPYDCAEMTSILAANLVFEFLCLLADRTAEKSM